MPHYTTNDELAALVTEWRTTGVMPARLVAVVQRTVRGLRVTLSERLRHHYPLDDHYQDAVLRLLVIRDRIDVGRNLFSLLTHVVLNAMRMRVRNAGRFLALVSGGPGDSDNRVRRQKVNRKGRPYYTR